MRFQSPEATAAGRRPRRMTRRHAAGVIGLAGCGALLGGCDEGGNWHATNVTGSSPELRFTMTRAADGKEVTQADYAGKVVMLFFGYTFCPDVCPTTLANISDVLGRMGLAAEKVRALFVTVDPARDTLPVLASYVDHFAPQVVGLRGTEDQIVALARRYRIVHSVTPAHDGQPYEVSHSSAVYVFDGTGAARLLIASLSQLRPDIHGIEADLRRLVEEEPPRGLISRLLHLV